MSVCAQICVVVDYDLGHCACVRACVCAGVSVCVHRWEHLVSYVNVNGIVCGCEQRTMLCVS